MALQNSVTTDRAIAARRRANEAAMVDHPGGEAGPVRYSLGFSYSIALNDNVNYSENDASGDLIQTPSLELGLGVPLTQRSSLGLQVGLGYEIYWHNENLSRWRLDPGSEIAYDLQIDDVFLTLYNRFSYTQDINDEPGVANRDDFPRFQNTVGLQATWVPGDLLFSAGYSFQIERSGSDANSYIDRDSHLLVGRAGHLFAEGDINTGVEVSGTFSDYLQNINSDTTVISLGPYFEWGISESLDVSLRGGYAFYTYSTVLAPDESTDNNTYYLGLSADQALTEYIGHGLQITHGVGPGAEQGTAFTIQTDVGYGISYDFIDPASVRLAVNYAHGEQEASVGGLSETYDQVRLTIGFHWTVSSRLDLSLAYGLTTRDSDLPDRSYTRNQISLGGSYAF